MAAEPTAGERFRQNASGIAATLITGLWLGLLVSGVGGNLWLAVMLFGYVAVVPIISMLFDEEESEVDLEEDEKRAELNEETDATDALETLRDRYARGELTDDQFERKLEYLLETESLEDLEDRVSERDSRLRSRDRSLERE
ncbi:SHOCT domain-containing protein [Natrialbaceae archaeon A-chndr2]|uniref:SHOCT domain-containing protein n=1 Tax=Natronosalvus hydrolyticus TaxID=2979988 RepID=A0AAP2Z911_9EURY|nr:SHOCT domain-containing protein [Halobacteria archaeon AArc-curdl1]